MVSKAFGSRGPVLPHLLQSGGALGEIADLRKDVEAAMLLLESKSGYPQINKMSSGIVDLSDLGGAVKDLDLTGTDFVQDQTFDAAVIGTGTASLHFAAIRPGDSGITVTIIDSDDDDDPEVTVDGSDITIDLHGNPPTAADMASQINSADPAISGGANLLVDVTTSGGGGGTVLVAVKTELAGGVGLGLELYVNGLSQAIDTAVTDMAISGRLLNVAAIGSPSNLEIISVMVVSNGRASNAMQLSVQS